MCDSTVPSESTASMPRSWARIGPYRSTRSPPALVATAPPTVALCRLAMKTPRSRPGSASATCCRLTPAPGADLPGVKIDRAEAVQPGQAEHHLAVERDAAAARPVFPPCGTTATPASAHSASSAATCSVPPGRSTAGVLPANPPVQSTA